MPEGHVLHRLAGALDEHFAGRTVQVTSPQGRFADSAALLDGQPLLGAEAYGKHLFVDFEPGIVHIHLGLIGKLRIHPLAPPVGVVRLRIADDSTAADLHGPQHCALITRAERDAAVAPLGPDPIRADADPEVAWQRIHRSGRSIGALLMDQKITAGVGNIYRAEVLFRQRIRPDRPGKLLRRASWEAIWTDLVVLMAAGVRDGRIDTVRPEDAPEITGRAPRDDPHGGEVYVYRRAGQPCLVCGSPVRSGTLEGRNLYWCANCQRRG